MTGVLISLQCVPFTVLFFSLWTTMKSHNAAIYYSSVIDPVLQLCFVWVFNISRVFSSLEVRLYGMCVCT